MKINAKSIPGEGLTLEEYETPSDLGLTEQDATVVGKVRTIVHITKMRNSFYVKGHSEATIKRECGRCLEEFQQKLGSDFELIFQAAGSMGAYWEKFLQGRDVGISFYYDDKIDLDPEIRQGIILAIPMKSLCREDCKGLCPGCGENLNEGICTCNRDASSTQSGAKGDSASDTKKGILGELLASALDKKSRV